MSRRTTKGATAVVLFTQAHQEALELEVSILQALLARNRQSHARTKYYQRLSMFMRHFQRASALDWWEHFSQLEEQVTAAAKGVEKRKRPKEQESVLRDTTLECLCQDVCVACEQVLPRLEFAAQALFQEVSRGFFLPLCTVALGTLARIRSLLHVWLQSIERALPLIWQYYLQQAQSSTQPSLSSPLSTGLSRLVQETLERARKVAATNAAETADSSSQVAATRTACTLRSLGLTPSLSQSQQEEQSLTVNQQHGNEEEDLGQVALGSVAIDLADKDRSEEIESRLVEPPTDGTDGTAREAAGESPVTDPDMESKPEPPVPKQSRKSSSGPDDHERLRQNLLLGRQDHDDKARKRAASKERKPKKKSKKKDFFDDLFR